MLVCRQPNKPYSKPDPKNFIAMLPKNFLLLQKKSNRNPNSYYLLQFSLSCRIGRQSMFILSFDSKK